MLYIHGRDEIAESIRDGRAALTWSIGKQASKQVIHASRENAMRIRLWRLGTEKAPGDVQHMGNERAE